MYLFIFIFSCYFISNCSIVANKHILERDDQNVENFRNLLSPHYPRGKKRIFFL